MSNAAQLASLYSAQPMGFVNKFRNAALDIWQRGTSGTITAGTPAMTADGWVVGSTGANVTWAQVASPFSPAGTVNALKITGASSVTDAFLRLPIESIVAAPLAGQTVTVQFAVYNGSGASLTPTLTVKHAGSADVWTSPTTDVSSQALQTIANGSSGVVSYTFSCPSGATNGLSVTLDFGSALNGAGNYVTVGQADIRVCTAALTPELRPQPIEWKMCQRYLPGFFADADSQFFANGAVQSSGTNADIGFQFSVPTRSAVTAIVSSGSSTFQNTNNGAVQTVTSIAFNMGGRTGAGVIIGLSPSMTANQATQLWSKGGAAYLLFTGAEILGA